MREFGLHHILRLAVIALLMANVVPEALAAFPVCKFDFEKTAVAAAQRTIAKHSHVPSADHECVATMPDRQVAAGDHRFAPDHAPAILPPLPHPAFLLAARGPSPRGSPTCASAYLSQRSSVLLLI